MSSCSVAASLGSWDRLWVWQLRRTPSPNAANASGRAALADHLVRGLYAFGQEVLGE